MLVGEYQQLYALKTLLLEGRVLVILRTVSLVQLPNTTICAEISERLDSQDNIFTLSRKILEGRTSM